MEKDKIRFNLTFHISLPTVINVRDWILEFSGRISDILNMMIKKKKIKDL